MTDWREDLKNKFNQITEGGDKDGDSRSDIRNSFRGSSSIRLSISNRTTEIKITEKEKIEMITRDAALDDLEKLEAEAKDSVSVVVIKVAKILVKILTTIRSNQLLTDTDKAAIKKAKVERSNRPESKTQD